MKNKIIIVGIIALVIFAITRIDFRSTEEYYAEEDSDNTELVYQDEDNEKTTLDGYLQNSDEKENSKKSNSNSNSNQKSNNNKSSSNSNVKVTIYIDVKNLLDTKNYAKLKPQLRKYVPSSGYVLERTTISVKKGSTAFDILQKATRLNKIQMEYQGANENAYSSVYIQGINHIYEFSAGSESGWMYSVNGKFPSYGFSNYTMKNGDTLRVVYTVDLGCDVGHSVKSCN